MTGAKWFPLGLSRTDFPIKSLQLRKSLATDHAVCPECGGDLDTGQECNDCGFDAMPETRAFVIGDGP